MSFVSIEFLGLFAIVVPLYYALPQRLANLLLLGASCVFYGYWYPPYLILLLGTIFCDYRLARWIEESDRPNARRSWLIVSLAINFGILFIFKYLNFFSSLWRFTGSHIAPAAGSGSTFFLPIGISFYTFQEVSYVLDVYARRIRAVQRFDQLALFVSFFPQLVAGPIERAGNLLPQFAAKHRFDEGNVVDGLRLMLLGFLKKLVIADRVAVYVNEVYSNPRAHDASTLSVATAFFAVQIYADFSAYSDIAIGTARVLGFRLMTNFRQPYFSQSVSEFWRRWHISLSTWFRDYVYVPMGGSRVSRARWRVSILVVFLLSGLWHGADLKFVLWGGLHGLALIGESLVRRLWTFVAPVNTSLSRGVAWAVTSIFVCVAWVPFRAESLADTRYIWRHFLAWPASMSVLAVPAGGRLMLMGMLMSVLFLFVIDGLDARGALWSQFARWPRPARWCAYYAASACVLWFGMWGKYDFIYFQF